MPYITPQAKDRLSDLSKAPMNAGELNYCITTMILEYYSERKNYQAINDILGALEGAKLEFYRRRVARYEDQKAKDNGDVYA